MRAIGIDPGFASCGWGVVERVGTTHFLRSQGTIRTTPADGDTATRLLTICRHLVDVVQRWSPDVVGVEDVELRPRQAAKEHVSQDGLLQTAKVVGIACCCAPATTRVVLLTNGQWRAALGVRRAEDVRERLTWMLGDLGGSVHSRDAAGIALAALARAEARAA